MSVRHLKLKTSVLTVTALNSHIKRIIDNDLILSDVEVEGEISNFKKHTSGHLYFTLKDQESRVNCVMFRTDALKLKKLPQDGDKVNIKGRVSVYVQGGNYQIYVRDISSQGAGDLYQKFMEIKDRLSKEGLFDQKIKRPLPVKPSKIAVITSPTGAAIRDIIKVTKNRFPSQKLVIFPVQVQGAVSESEVINALEMVNRRDDIDVVIIARGGGSIEDLWSFNSEMMAYAIRRSRIPVVTGIGHDIDYTIADFAADLRGATPSHAAELTVPSASEMSDAVENMRMTLKRNLDRKLRIEENRLELYLKLIKQNDPAQIILNRTREVSDKREMLCEKIRNYHDREARRLENAKGLLKAYNPQNVLNKGYSIIEDSEGRLVDSVEKLKDCEIINITMKDGKAAYRGEYTENGRK